MSSTKNVSELLKRTQFDKDLGIDRESEILGNGEHEDADCWDRFKKRIGQYCQALINYLECDRMIPLPDLQDEHYQKRFLEVFDESYSERSRRFAYTFQDVLEAKHKEEEQKQKTCWVEFKRLICCEGGNEMDEIDEKYIEDKDYEQIIRQERIERRKLMTQQEIQEIDPETITPESVEQVEQLQEVVESNKSNSKPKDEPEENSQLRSQQLKLVQVVPKEKPIDKTEQSVFKQPPVFKDKMKTPSTSPSQEALHSNHTNITEENLLTEKVVTHYTKIIHRNVIEEEYIDQVKRRKRGKKINIQEEEEQKEQKGKKKEAQTEQIQDESLKKKMKKERAKRASQKQSDVPPLMMTQSKVQLISKEKPEQISSKKYPESTQAPSNNSRVSKVEVNDQSIQNVDKRISSSVTTVKQNQVEPDQEVKKKKNSPEIPSEIQRVPPKQRDSQTQKIKQGSASQETVVQLESYAPKNLNFEEESKTTPVKTAKKVRDQSIKVQQVSPQAFIFQEQQQIYSEKRRTNQMSPSSQIVYPVPPQQQRAIVKNNQPNQTPTPQNEWTFERRELPTVQITELPNKVEKFGEKVVQNANKNRTRPELQQLPNQLIPEESIQSQPIFAVNSIAKRRNKKTLEQNEQAEDPKFLVVVDSERLNTIDVAPETYAKKRRQRQINHHEEEPEEIIIHEQTGQYKRASTTVNLSNKKSLPAPSPIVPQVQLITSRIEKKRRKIQMKQEVDIEEEIYIEDI